MIKKRSLTGYHWDDVEDLFESQHPDSKEIQCLIRFYDWIVNTCLDGMTVYQATFAAGETTLEDVSRAEENKDEAWLMAFHFLVANNLLTPSTTGGDGYEFSFII